MKNGKGENLYMAEVNVSTEDIIIGRAFRDQLTGISSLTAESGLVTIQGIVEGKETRELRDGAALLCATVIKDNTASVLCRCFLNCRGHKQQEEEIGSITEDDKATVMNKVNRIAVGMIVTVRGECTYDIDTGELYILVRDLAGADKKAL